MCTTTSSERLWRPLKCALRPPAARTCPPNGRVALVRLCRALPALLALTKETVSSTGNVLLNIVHAQVPAALGVFDALVGQGLVPTATTFGPLIAALVGFGLTARAEELTTLRDTLRKVGMLLEGTDEDAALFRVARPAGRATGSATGRATALRSGAAWLTAALAEAEEVVDAKARSGGGGGLVVPKGFSAFIDDKPTVDWEGRGAAAGGGVARGGGQGEGRGQRRTRNEWHRRPQQQGQGRDNADSANQ